MVDRVHGNLLRLTAVQPVVGGVGAMRVPVLVLGAVLATAVLAAPPAGKHPLLGYWTFPVPGRGCAETTLYGSDGKVRVTSGAEVTESEYEVSPEPSAAGFYEYRDKVVKSNGLKDCTGESTPIGATAHWCIKFSADRNSYLMCQTATLKSCFGPVRRPPPASA